MSLLLNTTLHYPTKPELFILFVENGRICNKLPMEAIVVLAVFLFCLRIDSPAMVSVIDPLFDLENIIQHNTNKVLKRAHQLRLQIGKEK